MKRFFKFIAIFVISIILLFTVMGIWGYRMLSQSLPQTRGQLTVSVISDTIQIYRDKSDVPYIICKNEPDAWFAQGFVTAQDRLWQMDFLKRYVRGELSEIFGSSAFESDSLARFVGFGRIADATVPKLDSETYSILKNYTAGVNQAIEQLRGHWPVEFMLLNDHPRLWTISDCLAIFRWLTWTAQYGWEETLLQKVLDEKLGEILYRQYFDPDDIRNLKAISIPMASSIPWLNSPLGQFFTTGWIEKSDEATTLTAALHGELLCPSLWYEIHWFIGEQQTGGFCLPGIPMVLSGYRDSVAWTLGEPYLSSVILESSQSEETYSLRTDSIKIRDKKTRLVHFQESRCKRVLIPGTLAIDWCGFEPYNDFKWLIGLNRGQNMETAQQPNFGILMADANCDPSILLPRSSNRSNALLVSYLETRLNEGAPSQNLLTDVFSPVHREFLKQALPLLQTETDSASQASWIGRLQNWDGKMSRGSEEAYFVFLWKQSLLETAFKTELGKDLYAILIRHPNLCEDAILHRLSQTNDVQTWIREGFFVTLKQFTSPENQAFKGAWGQHNQFSYHHILGSHPLLAPTLNAGPYPAAGDETTILGTSLQNQPDTYNNGPVARSLLAIGPNGIDAKLALSTGQSGHPFSPFYKDQITSFHAGDLHSCLLDRERLHKTGWTKLTLEPGVIDEQ